MFKLSAPTISGFEFVKHGILIALGLLSTFLCMLNSLGLFTTVLGVQYTLRIKISANVIKLNDMYVQKQESNHETNVSPLVKQK